MLLLLKVLLKLVFSPSTIKTCPNCGIVPPPVPVVTVRVAGLLVTLPATLLTVTVNCALLSEEGVAGEVERAAGAPDTAGPVVPPPQRKGAVPVAPPVEVAVLPTVTVWLAGCVVMEGAVAALFTVSVAALLVTLPAVLLTTTTNLALLSAEVVAGVV